MEMKTKGLKTAGEGVETKSARYENANPRFVPIHPYFCPVYSFLRFCFRTAIGANVKIGTCFRCFVTT